MQQTYEYYIVDPGTWKDIKLLTTVKSSTINRDESAETLGSASIDLTESIGECYVRIYLVTVQNGVTERHPLGTFLVQTPSYSYNGKIKSVTVDAYTPLLELKENPPPIGYFVKKGANIMSEAAKIVNAHVRAPVVATESGLKLEDDFVSNTDDTWMSFSNDLIASANYKFSLDELGRILFSPNQSASVMRPVWTYDDGNSSILLPEISMDRDLYGIPNVVEVIYSNGYRNVEVRVVNDDPNSPISTVSRGREIVHRVINPDTSYATSEQIKEYAERLLESLSTLEYKVSYTHGYCPVRLGDCVRLDYKKAGITNVKAKVIKQSIKCTPGCQVSETAVFTTKLWG
jgi:hypothetical protein